MYKELIEAQLGKFSNSLIRLLQQLDYNFSVIGISETKIRDDKFSDFNPDIANYRFEFVPTPLASGVVGLYIRKDLSYTVLEKCFDSFGLKYTLQIKLASYVV
jgi:hypothetical protein